MSPWAEYYKGRVGESYAKYCEKRYAPFIEEIKKDGILYREEGCGIGTFSKILLQNRTSIFVNMIDKDRDMLDLLVMNFQEKGSYGLKNDLLIEKANLLSSLETKSFDVIFSHGVLEHFHDIAIKAILDNQRSAANKVVHYVPTDGYDAPSFGDERLLPYTYWIEHFNPTRYKRFNDKKDLLLVWE